MKLSHLLIFITLFFLGTFLIAHYSIASAQFNKTEDLFNRPLEYGWETIGDMMAVPASLTLGVPIITYHKIQPITPSDTANQRRFTTSPEEFELQMRYLKNMGYKSISLNELEQYLATHLLPPGKVVVITFDDGYQSQYDNAFPILKKYAYTATFFIFTSAIDRLDKYMTWKEVEELSREGMSIGNHTKTHAHLTMIKDPKILSDEIIGSKEIIEAHIGKPVTVFAYPFGEYNTTVVNNVASSGLVAAVGVRKGEMQTYERRYVLKRFNLNNEHKEFLSIFSK